MASRSEDAARAEDAACALLSLSTWTAAEVDYAIELHDLLEAPDGPPDPIAGQLRARLRIEMPRLEIGRQLPAVENVALQIRLAFFSAHLLDHPDPLTRRLWLLSYRGMVNFAGFQSGAHGQLDAAIAAFLELDRTVRAEAPRAGGILGEDYDAALLGLATCYCTRYDGRRDLLHGSPSPAVEREIRADLDGAVNASERAGASGNPVTRSGALAVRGTCYRYLYEDDERFGEAETLDMGITLLREAVGLAEAVIEQSGRTHGLVYNLYGVRDRLAGALSLRNSVPDIDAAIALYLMNRDDAVSVGIGETPGGAASLATAYLRRWMLTGDAADRERAREANAAAFAVGEVAHLPTAFDVAAQWGGLAWQERHWAEAGAAYQQATRVVHLVVRQQGSRADREWVIRKAPGVAIRAAIGLARAGALDDALVTLETGRAVLLTEMFDRRAVDYQRIASLAGASVADDYQRLTDDLTRLDTQLLLTGPTGDPAITAGIEETRKHRAALRARMPSAARATLADLDGSPTMSELRRAAGPATVVYLAATGDGGLALILRPGQAPVERVELDTLTVATAADLVSGLEHAVRDVDMQVCEYVCEQLWLHAMDRLLPLLRDAAEVVLIPGGAVAGLPWHAAKLPGRSAGHVLDQIAVSYMPNVRSLPVARAAWRGRPASLRALAIEEPESARPSQLHTIDEIEDVQAHHGPGFRVVWLPGAEATRQRLLEALTQFEVLHFAGHARADPDPLEGRLLLANGEVLTIRELLASGIGAARFAVLSACETARVEDPTSDEMVSFPTALMQCGFGGVVGSLWAANDRFTIMLMKAFYREWQGKSATPREALRAAQQRVRDQRHPSPLAWATFVYVGP